MTAPPPDLRVRIAGSADIGAVARLRWGPHTRAEPAFEQRIAGDHRLLVLSLPAGGAGRPAGPGP